MAELFMKDSYFPSQSGDR